MAGFKLILASASPRRKELIKTLFVDHEIIVSGAEEDSDISHVPSRVMENARLKAYEVFNQVSKTIEKPFVIGADTVVVNDHKVLEKPRDINQAREMLLQLSGRSHSVYTGVCFTYLNRGEVEHQGFYEDTQVTFDDISSDMLEAYLATNESLDKAGAYGIQGAALGFVKKIEGCYANVVGLPVNRLEREFQLNPVLKVFGNRWRQGFE